MPSFLPPFPLPTPTVLLDCVVAAALLIYLPFLVVAYGRFRLGLSSFVTPRAVFDKLPAYAQRAAWAHQNAFETFILFATAALMGYVTGLQSSLAAWAAIAFVTARLIYPFFYILNIPVGRSLMFAIGTLSTLTLFALSLMKVN